MKTSLLAGRLSRPTALVLVVFVAAACASTHSEQPKLITGKYRIDASDELEVRVFPEPIIERDLVVRPDGRVTFDFIGDVLVQGRTTDEVASDIRKRIARYRRDPVVNVVVKDPQSQEVVVGGEVESPDSYPALRGIRITDAISRAGDVTELAAASRVRLIRRDGDRSYVYLANLDAIRDGDESTNYLLHGGDVIYVPPATPVGIGYAIRRAFYPLEAVFRSIGSGLLAGLVVP